MNEPNPYIWNPPVDRSILDRFQVDLQPRFEQFKRMLKEVTGDAVRIWREYINDNRPICRREIPERGQE